jgi:SOS response regulatory protein OraA/RecX
VEKKLKKYPSLENEKENHKLKNKVMSFILSKGHEYEEALSFLEDHF